MPTQKNLASWDLQLGFNLAFKRLSAYYFGSREQKTHLYLQSTEYYQGFWKENCSINWSINHLCKYILALYVICTYLYYTRFTKGWLLKWAHRIQMPFII